MSVTLDDIQPGRSFREDWGEGNPNNRVIHIRAIVDDDYYVYRCWSKSKQRWIYNVDSVIWFRMLCKDGVLEER